MNENPKGQNPQKVPADLVPLDDESLRFAVQIMAGLLASGHYTQLGGPDGPPDEPSVRVWDVGKDWRECDLRKRYHRYVVEASVALLKDLRAELAESMRLAGTTDKAP